MWENIAIPKLSGERYSVTYRISGSEDEARARAIDITLEQTVEFPYELLPRGPIRDEVVGRIESFSRMENSRSEKDGAETTYEAKISFAMETAAGEITQLLNVVFGNISLKDGLRVERIDLCESLYNIFPGPRFGVSGLRGLLGIENRPILGTALKPMGLSSRDLSDLAYRFALGGIDIIKDDHGLTDQKFAPFEERVSLCADAVRKANKESGHKSIYTANVTAPFDELMRRARFAKDAGAGALMIAPGLTGFSAMKTLADDSGLGLPVFSHPAFLGASLNGASALSYFFALGQLQRLSGADAVIYPNYGGRFSISKEQCLEIARGAREPMGRIQSIFPFPGGGMSLEAVSEMHEMYGNDLIYLIGGGLFRRGDDLVENCKYFRSLIDKY